MNLTNTNLLKSHSSYVLICGSYQKNRNNDKLCEYLGVELAKQDFKMISGGGVPAINIAESMAGALDELNNYDSSKIVTVLRRKPKGEEIRIKRVGSILFEGNTISELRNFLFSNAWALVVIGGATKTREEVLIAQELNMPIIPLEISGGTASMLWQQYYRSRKYHDETLFLQLKSKNLLLAANASVRTLDIINSKQAATFKEKMSAH